MDANGQDENVFTKQHAESLDAQDPLHRLRKEFIIPTKADLKRKTLARPAQEESEECIYLCGNSLGLQPRRTKDRIQAFLAQWSTKAVTGHFVEHEDSPLAPFLHVDDHAAKLMAPIVGAMESEVAVMGQLTTNLLLMMGSFYRPSKEKYKIILEGKAFPSDHYAIESQLTSRGFDPREAMILIEPDRPAGTISTEHILETIDKHASDTALVLLPGIQFYTGQYFDIPKITNHAHSKGILIGWDCAHAAGNVPLKLHDWHVDFAVWCNYKYLNSGPGAIAAIFVHEKHGKVNMEAKEAYRPRLCGWWGADKVTRFQMDNKFVPRPGAAGYQVSNPSALDLSALVASLEVFGQTSMADLRRKSICLTKYLENLLLEHGSRHTLPFTILTSRDAEERGAQLSLRLEPGLLDSVLHSLEDSGVVVDERKPDVIRVAPAPLYNTFLDVWNFVRVFGEACQKALHDEEATANGSASHADDRIAATTTAETAQARVEARGAKAYGPNAE